MTIVDNVKFGLGCLFAVLAVAQLYRARRGRGFDQNRQIAALLVGGAVFFLGRGLGQF